MQEYEIEPNRWALKLAPQLTGKAQQAYAAMEQTAAIKYEEVKAAILRRYEINEETYQQLQPEKALRRVVNWWLDSKIQQRNGQKVAKTRMK